MANDQAATKIATANELGELCNGHPEYVADAFPQLVDLLSSGEDAAVLVAVADAFGNMWDRRCVAPLLELARHQGQDVRLAATRALFGCNDDDPSAVATLMQLTRDDDGEIRDWATFALAGGDTDSPAIRDALWERINDPAGDTRGEALVGLAKRKDRRAEAVIARLLTDKPGNLIVEAAAELAAPSLYPLLTALRDSGWQKNDSRPYVLDEALRVCMPGPVDSQPQQPTRNASNHPQAVAVCSMASGDRTAPCDHSARPQDPKSPQTPPRYHGASSWTRHVPPGRSHAASPQHQRHPTHT